MAQLLATAGGLSYISNFVARFYDAPAVGALIEKSLGLRDAEWASSFRSEYGLTDGLREPHEFGYFWDRWFDLGQPMHRLDEEALAKVNRRDLTRELASIEAVCEQSVAYKNNTWCTLQSEFLSHLFPKSVFVVCRRDPLYVAQSLLLGRRARHGDANIWWSVKPTTYSELAELSVWEQVAGQAIDFEREMDAQIDRIPAGRVVDVPYEALCEDPCRFVMAVHDGVGRLGYTLDRPRPLPARFESKNRPRLRSDEWRMLQAATDRMLTRPIAWSKRPSDGVATPGAEA
jgi:hypothetical protein